jgi:hypothetical protein
MKKILAWLIGIPVGFCVLLIAIGFIGAAMSDHKQPAQTALLEQAEAPETTYRVGDVFTVGKLTCEVKKIKWAKSLGAYSTADANYLILNLTVKNNDTSPTTLGNFHLRDEVGSKYDQEGIVIGLNNELPILTTLNPQVQKTGQVAFDVPKNHTYKLVVNGGLGESDEALVALNKQKEAP